MVVLLQVDNPIAILNQDSAKTFLANSNPGKLYDLFMRATLIDQFKKELNAAEQEKEMAKVFLREKENSLPLMEKEVRERDLKSFFNKGFLFPFQAKKWKMKLEQLQTMKKRHETIQDMNKKMMWALVDEGENVLR